MNKFTFCASLALIASSTAWAATPITFEVASMKSSPPPGNIMRVGCTGGPGTSDPGRISCERMNLRSLVMRAYDMKTYQVSGPDWMTEVTYDIVATLPPGTTKEQVLE